LHRVVAFIPPVGDYELGLWMLRTVVSGSFVIQKNETFLYSDVGQEEDGAELIGEQ
jgi:hypothetical protein